MKRTFKPTRKNLPPRVIRTLERKRLWHIKNGYGSKMTLDEMLKHKIGVRAGSFLLLVEDGGTRHHGNAAVAVFNEKGLLVDDRVWFNPVKGKKVPRKAFIGTPIVDGAQPMKYRPLRKKDTLFKS